MPIAKNEVSNVQANRLFQIIYILLGRKSVTAGELAERLGVSQRTIYRDVDALSLAGIPVYTEKGKGGGISLLPEFVLNKSILSEQEQNEILSALQGLSSVRTQDTEQVLKKLSAVFNRSTVNWLEVDFSDWGYQNGDYFNRLKTAILEQRVVRFEYFSSYGERTERAVEPMQLWFKSKAWYIKGYCLARRDMRVFKLSRIKNLRITEERFGERSLLDIEPESAPEWKSKRDVTLKLKIAPEMAYRVYDEFGDRAAEMQQDGSFIVRVIWPEDEWVYGTVLSFGEHIEVLEPEHIRRIIREKAEKICKINTQE